MKKAAEPFHLKIDEPYFIPDIAKKLQAIYPNEDWTITSKYKLNDDIENFFLCHSLFLLSSTR